MTVVGLNYFNVIRVRGPSSVSGQWSPDAVLIVKEEMFMYKPAGPGSSLFHSWLLMIRYLLTKPYDGLLNITF
jgi:hypothetical protein